MEQLDTSKAMKIILTQLALLIVFTSKAQNNNNARPRELESKGGQESLAAIRDPKVSSVPKTDDSMKSLDHGIVRFDFGDGSVSHIYPPRPYSDGHASLDRTFPCHAILDRVVLNSAPVANVNEVLQDDDEVTETAPVLEEDRDHWVLVFRGDFVREISVRATDRFGNCAQYEEEGRTKLGRWELPPDVINSDSRFLVVQDNSAGSRWVIPTDPANN